MKNSFLVLVFVVFCFGAAQGQITLQYTFPAAFNYMSIVRFGYAGDKYLKIDYLNNRIQIYSLSQTLEKEISIPQFIPDSLGYNIYYVSDNLFDLDSSVEYMALSYGIPFILFVLKEDGSIILSRDSVGPLPNTNANLSTQFANIFPSTDGTKLIIYKIPSGDNEVYSLPGNLPCYECNSGEYSGNLSSAGNTGNQNRNSLGNPYPNPTNNLTRIDYQLPNGIQQGELVFYNTMGTEVKRFKVTNTFSFIYVSAHDLPSGTYYYNLQTSAGASDGKKMVVIR